MTDYAPPKSNDPRGDQIYCTTTTDVTLQRPIRAVRTGPRQWTPAIHQAQRQNDQDSRLRRRFAPIFRGDPEIILGGGAQTLFGPVGGGCFVDNVSEGWGGGEVTCPGGQGVFDP